MEQKDSAPCTSLREEGIALFPEIVVSEAFRLRKLTEPARHLFLRTSDPAALAESSVGRRQGTLEPFEPTAFLYAFTAFNALYSVDWSQSLSKRFSEPVEAEGRWESTKINSFLEFILSDQSEREYFVERFHNVKPSGERGLVEELGDLLPFPPRKKSLPEGLEHRVVEACERLLSQAPMTSLLEDVREIFTAIYEVRCNIFHGRKSVIDLKQDDAQIIRIGIFRQVIVAILDTFFAKVGRVTTWDPYFDGHLSDTLAK